MCPPCRGRGCDAACTIVSPALPAVERLLTLSYRVGEHNGGNSYLGRHHKRLLLEAGLVRPEVHPLFESNATLEATRQIAETFVLRLQGPVQEAVVLGEGWATREELDAMYAAMYAWGERADAFLGRLLLGALGWTG